MSAPAGGAAPLPPLDPGPRWRAAVFDKLAAPLLATDNGPPCAACSGTCYGYKKVEPFRFVALCWTCHAWSIVWCVASDPPAAALSALHRARAARADGKGWRLQNAPWVDAEVRRLAEGGGA